MNTTIRKEFVDTFNKLTHKLSPWEVWKDFVVMCSCSFSNALDKSHYDNSQINILRRYKQVILEVQPLFFQYALNCIDSGNQCRSCAATIIIERYVPFLLDLLRYILHRDFCHDQTGGAAFQGG